jgi:hypothetical protein
MKCKGFLEKNVEHDHPSSPGGLFVSSSPLLLIGPWHLENTEHFPARSLPNSVIVVILISHILSVFYRKSLTVHEALPGEAHLKSQKTLNWAKALT